MQVANAIGTSHSTVLRWEKGELQPDTEKIRLLAELYGCSVAELDFPPERREAGQRVDRALRILADMEPEDAQKWLDIGERLTKPKP